MKVSNIILACFVTLILAISTEAQNNLSEFGMPVAFTENMGQFGERTLFKAEANGASFYFCSDEVAYLFVRNTDELIEDELPVNNDLPEELRQPRYKKESILIKTRFIGASQQVEVTGEEILGHISNYFHGNDPDQWRTNVSSYSSIVYHEIYPRIDLKYYGNGKSLKYDFIVNSGADISQIRIRYEGIDYLDVTTDGDLEISTSFGEIYEKAPRIYQDINGSKTEINGRYEIKEPGFFGFVVDEGYDPDLPLIIDPYIEYSTYLGASKNDKSEGIAVDSEGSTYIVSNTNSYYFPVANPYDESRNDGDEIVVSKLSASGNYLVYSTYLGGSHHDYGKDIAVDINGNAYITGYTNSSDFPLANQYDDGFDGDEWDCFLAKLSNLGNALLYSTYFGGSENEYSYGIAADTGGNAFVAGFTRSSDFPTANPYDGILGGDGDVFIAKFNTQLSGSNSLIFSTYYGGSYSDMGSATESAKDIAVDSEGCSYITGYTYSSDLHTVNAYSTSKTGWEDIFIVKFSNTGHYPLYATYLGGTRGQRGNCIDVDDSGNAYIIGLTDSRDFPIINAYDTTHNDIFVVKIATYLSGDSSLLYSTYFGGSDSEYGNGIAVNSEGEVYFTGTTYSEDMPIVDAFDGSYNGGDGWWGGGDAFVAKLSAQGDDLLYSTFFGGSDGDVANGIAVDESGNAYIAGNTESINFPVVNAFDGDYNGGRSDIFIANLNFGMGGTVTGTVSDDDGFPIEGVFVTDENNVSTDTTDYSGEYVLSHLQPGSHDIFYISSEYCAAIAADVYTDPGETVYVDIEMAAGGPITGTVNNENYNPVDNVLVEVEGTGIKDSTDVNGNFWLTGLCEGTYDISFTHIGYVDTSIVDITVNPTDTSYVDLVIGVGSSICGLVTDSSLNPIGEVTIVTIDFPANETSNSQGEYCLNGLPAGSYNISFIHPDYFDTVISNISVNENDTINLNVTLRPPTPDVTIWIGTIDDSPVVASIGGMLEINIYFHTTAYAYGADFSFPLGINNAYLNTFDGYSCQIHYPFSHWDSKSFGNLNEDYMTDSTGSTWDSYTFTGFAELPAPYDSPLLHTDPVDPPILGLTFAVEVKDDSTLDGQIIPNAIGPGQDPISGPANMGDPYGGPGNSLYQIFSSIRFVRYLYLPGDANISAGLWPPTVIGGDVTYLVNYFKGEPANPGCTRDGFYAPADVNGDCLVIGSDATKLVNYFRGEANISWCPDFAPAWPTPDDLPPEAPESWPNCE